MLRFRRATAFAAGFHLALLFVALTPTAEAATFVVANGDVTGLASAITTANTNGEVDTIHLAPAGTYTLTTVDNTSNGVNGLPVIESDGGNKLSVIGYGATITRDAAAPDFRFLEINGAEVELRQITFSNGREAGMTGGAGATGTSGRGGAIYNLGTLTIIGCTFDSNTSVGGNGGDAFGAGASGGNGGQALGGAIYSFNGTVTITGGRFVSNTVSSGSGGTGGAGSTVAPPPANGGNAGAGGEARGGAIYVNGGTLACTAVTFESNQATGGAGGTGGAGDNRNPGGTGGLGGVGGHTRGGAIYGTSSTMSVAGCTFESNNCTGGTGGTGGAGGEFGGGGGFGSQGGFAGGSAIYVFANTSTTLTNSTLDSNTGITGDGGNGGDAGQTSGGDGGNGGPSGFGRGAIYTASGSAETFAFLTIVFNSATAGTGGSGGNGGPGRNAGIGGGVATTTGGGLSVASGTVTLTNCVIGVNTAGNGPNVDDANDNITSSYNVVQNVGSLFNNFGGTNDVAAVVNIGPLQDNGGAVKTRMPLAGSPALGNGLAGVPLDARGLVRSDPPDCGAVEVGTVPLLTVLIGGTPIPTGQNLDLPTGVTLSSLGVQLTGHEDSGETLSVTVGIDTPFSGYSASEWGNGTTAATPPLQFSPSSGIFDTSGTHTLTITLTDASASFTVWTGTVTVDGAVTVVSADAVGGGGGGGDGSSGGCQAGTGHAGCTPWTWIGLLALAGLAIRRRR